MKTDNRQQILPLITLTNSPRRKLKLLAMVFLLFVFQAPKTYSKSMVTPSGPFLSIATPSECNTASIRYDIAGQLAACWPLGLEGPPSSPAYWSGTHYLQIRDADGPILLNLNYAIGEATQNPGFESSVRWSGSAWCSRMIYDESILPQHLNGFLHELEAGDYFLYFWTEYTVTAIFNGVFVPMSGTAGQVPPPVNTPPATSFSPFTDMIEVSEEDVAYPLDSLEWVKVHEVSANLVPVYDCAGPTRVDFKVSQISSSLANSYKVNVSWAEVANCNVVPSNYSDPRQSNLIALLDPVSTQYTNVLRLPNLKNSTALNSNPFNNTQNLNKFYKVRFELFDPVCEDTLVHEQCVFYIRGGSTLDSLSLMSCEDDPACGFTFEPVFQDPQGSYPLMGTETAGIRLNSTGPATGYRLIIRRIYLDSLGQPKADSLSPPIYDAVTQQSITTFRNTNNPWNDIILNNLVVPAFGSWQGGTNYFRDYATQNNLLYYRFDLELENCERPHTWSYMRFEPGVLSKSINTQPDIAAENHQLTSGTVRFYPNPVNTELVVDSDTPLINISIMDIHGRIWQNYPYLTGRNTLGVHELPSGVYILHYQTADGSMQTQKIVKQ
jgi:hypothetical protein